MSRSRPAGRVRVVDGDVGGVDGEFAAGGHGVAGVDGEVDQNLFELAGVGSDRPQPGGGGDDQVDVLAEGAAQQVLEAGGDVVEVEDLWVRDVAAGEDQQLAGEPRGALGCAADLLDVGEHGLQPLVAAAHPGGDVFGDELGVAADDIEQVVEVVRDAADELAEAFQPLRLLQPPFEAFLVGFGAQPFGFGLGGQPLGDVADGHRHLVSGCGGQRAEADLDRELPPVLADRGPLQALAHRPGAWVGEIAGLVLLVGLPPALGDQDLDRLAGQLIS